MNNWKWSRFVSVAAAAALAVSGMGILPQSEEPAEAAGTLTGLTARQITDQMVIGWNLGNTLDSHGAGVNFNTAPGKAATSWGNPEPSLELIQTVKAGGFNTIRIPTTWYQHIQYDDAQGMYVVNEDWMDYVKMTVDYAYNEGMFVILNVHHENWVNVSQFTDQTYATASAILEDIWTQVADEFADYDQHLIFEGMNEPRQTGLGSSVEWGAGDSNSQKYINDLNAIFVNTIRNQGSSANKERLLMLPGYCASSQAAAINAIAIPSNGGNIALSVHAYAPYFFTMDTSSYANHTFPGSSGYGEDYEYHLTNLFNSLKSISQSKGAPIIIGEFSASDFDNTDSRVNWAKSYLSKAKDAGIPCVLWDNNESYNGTGEAHGYVYRKTNTWYTNSIPVVQAMMDVYGVSCTLPEYQEYVKPAFDWSNIPVGDDWIELYRPDGGKELAAWGSCSLSKLKQYITEAYEIVVVYQSDAEPFLVFQGDWHKVYASEVSDNPYMLTFTYDDVVKGLAGDGVTLEQMTKSYVGAAGEEMTLYGVFAVPLEQPTEAPTEVPSEDFFPGDVNHDNQLTILDIIWLQRYMLGLETIQGDVQQTDADVNRDGVINVFDLGMLKKLILNA